MARRLRSSVGFWREWAVLTVGRAVAAVAAAGVFAVSARHTSQAEFGIFAIAASIATVVAIVIDCGASQLAIRHVGLSLQDWSPRHATLGVRLALLLTGLSAAAIGWLAVASPDDQHVVEVAGFVAAYASVLSTETLSLSLLVGLSRTGLAVLLQLFDRLLSLAVLLVAGVTGHWVAGSYLSLVCGSGLAIAWLAMAHSEQRDWNQGPASLSERFGFVKFSGASQIQNFEVSIVGSISGSTQAAFIGLGSRLTGPLAIAVGAGSTLLLRRTHGATGVRGRIAGISLLTAAPLFAAGCLPTRMLANILGDGYGGAVPTLRIVLITVAVNCFAQPVAAFMQSLGDAKFVGNALLGCALMGLVTCAAGASLDGATGGALGMLTSQVLQVLVLVPRLRDLRRGEPARCPPSS